MNFKKYSRQGQIETSVPFRAIENLIQQQQQKPKNILLAQYETFKKTKTTKISLAKKNLSVLDTSSTTASSKQHDLVFTLVMPQSTKNKNVQLTIDTTSKFSFSSRNSIITDNVVTSKTAQQSKQNQITSKESIDHYQSPQFIGLLIKLTKKIGEIDQLIKGPCTLEKIRSQFKQFYEKIAIPFINADEFLQMRSGHEKERIKVLFNQGGEIQSNQFKKECICNDDLSQLKDSHLEEIQSFERNICEKEKSIEQFSIELEKLSKKNMNQEVLLYERDTLIRKLEQELIQKKKEKHELNLKIKAQQECVKDFAQVIKENDELRMVVKEFNSKGEAGQKEVLRGLVEKMSSQFLNKRNEEDSQSCQLSETELLMIEYLDRGLLEKMSDQENCKNCVKLKEEFGNATIKNKELEEMNEKLKKEIEIIMVEAEQRKDQSPDVEGDLKRGILSSMNTSSLAQSIDARGQDETGSDSGSMSQSFNIKKFQQELRVSKKAEQLAKDKLAQTKKSLERTEKEFLKYREESENRNEILKHEIQILQTHYNQLQSSVNETESDKSSGEKNSDLMQIIEQYKRTIDQKSQENEMISSKMQNKSSKVHNLKKLTTEQEQKIGKLKGALDNVKTFLRLLNTNFIKSVKQQNAYLKEQCKNSEREFIKEIENTKQLIQIQINKIVTQKEKQVNAQLSQGSSNQQQLNKKLEEAQAQFDQLIKKSNHEHSLKLQQQKDDSSKVLAKYKLKLGNLKKQQEDISKNDNRDQIYEELKQKKHEVEKQLEVVQLQLENVKEKNVLGQTERQNEIKRKDSIINDFKMKEKELVSKMEEQEKISKSEIKSLLDKIESDKMTWYQKEVAASGQREAERIRELRELLEQKIKEQTKEIVELKEDNQRQDSEYAKLKEESSKKNDQLSYQLKELEKEYAREKEQLNLQLNKSGNKLSKKITSLNEINIKLTEQIDLQKRIESENNTYKQRVQELETKYNDKEQSLNEKEKYEVNQIEKEISLKERIEELETSLKSLQKELKQKEITFQDISKLLNNKEVELKGSQIQVKELESANKSVKKELEDYLKRQFKETTSIEIQTEIEQKIQQSPLLVKNVKNESKDQDVQTETIEISKEQKDSVLEQKQIESTDELPAPESNKEVIRGTRYGQEEETYVQEPVEESIEMKVQQREISHDMAMRAPFGQGGSRSPAPRPQMMGRGRGMVGPSPRPGFNPGQFQQRPPMQQQVHQQMPIQEETIPQDQQKSDFTQEQPQSNEQIKEIAEQKNEPPRQASFNQQPPRQISPQKVQTRQNIQQQLPLKQDSPSKPAEKKDDAIKAPTQNNPLPTMSIDQKKDKTSHPREQQKEVSKEREISQTERKSEQEQKKEESKQEETSKASGISSSNQQSMFDFKNNRLFGMINGILSMLTRKKQGYTGKPASQMYYDEKKGRYIIDGEEESDDDVPPPPPPRKVIEEAKKEESKKEENAVGADSLGKVAFGGTLANRGRGRGRGAPVNRFPQTFSTNQLQPTTFKPPTEESQEKVETQRQQEENDVQVPMMTSRQEIRPIIEEVRDEQFEDQPSELYTTTLDITMAQDQRQFDPQREDIWQDKFKQTTDKINQLKYKNSMLYQELRMQREENEQTIENFTILCQDLKFKSIDEVEDLQTDIQILRDQLRKVAQEKAMQEIKMTQLGDSCSFYESDNQDLSEQVRDLRYKLIQTEIEVEMAKLKGLEEKQDQHSYDESYKQILDLQIQNDSLQWEKAILEAEKLQIISEKQEHNSEAEKQKIALQSLEIENTRLQEDVRQMHNEIIELEQEQSKIGERERECMKELINKLQAEKERVQEQHRARISEYDQKVKANESERNKQEQEFTKMLKEKDQQLEELKKEVLPLRQQSQTKDVEIQKLIAQAKDLQQKLTNQTQKRQSESEQTEQIMKQQLTNLKVLADQKSQQLQQYENKNEEIAQELQNQTMLRDKLNEHIVYLQNEIRKRDELLETSEFGDFELIGDDDDSVLALEDESIRGGDLQSNKGEDEIRGMVSGEVSKSKRKKRTVGFLIQTQLDDTRSQLKKQIEEKLKIETDFNAMSHIQDKLKEGLQDILSILDQKKFVTQNIEQSSLVPDEQEESKSQEEPFQVDEVVHQIISKAFAMQRYYESELSELQHNSEMMKLQNEETETLKFDNEFLYEEKSMLDSEINQLRNQLKEGEQKLNEARTMINDRSRNEEEIKKQCKLIKDEYEDKLKNQKQEYESRISTLNDDAVKQMQELHETFQKDVLPRLKEKHSKKYEELKRLIQQLKDENNSINQELTQKTYMYNELDGENQRLSTEVNQSRMHDNEEQERQNQSVQYIQLQKEEVESELNQLKIQYNTEKTNLEQTIEQLGKELEETKSQYEEQISSMTASFEDIAMRMKQKLNGRKKKMDQMIKIIKELQETQQDASQMQAMKEELNKEKADILQEQEIQMKELKGYYEQKIQAHLANEGELEHQIAKLKEQYQEKVEVQLSSLNVSQVKLEESLQAKEEQVKDLQVELQKVNQEKTEMEEEFKTQGEMIVKKLKSHNKKEKERSQKLQEELAQLQREKEELEHQLEEERYQSESQLSENQNLQKKRIASLETDIQGLYQDIEQKEIAIKVLERKIQQMEDVNEEIQNEKEKIIQQVKEILSILGIEITSEEWNDLYDKLKEQIQNYDEDKRSLQKMIEEREQFAALAEELKWKYNQITEEKSQLEQKLEGNLSIKLEKKVKVLEEERSEMKSDFHIKINSFVEEISHLKDRLSRYESIQELEEQESSQQETSFKAEESKIKDETMQRSIDEQERKSGIFNSIASFFLTDSELQ